MANLSTLLGSGDEGGQVLDPLPTFCIWTNYANNQRIYSVYDSYMQPISSGFYDTGTEQWSNYASWHRTDSSIGSSSGSSYFGQSCSSYQSEGHWFVNPPAHSGSYAPITRPYWFMENYWAYFGTVISPKGLRQRISPYLQGNSMHIYEFGGPTMVSYVSLDGNLLETSGEPASTAQGTISYNANTKKLVAIRGNSSNSYRLHVWFNPNIDLNSREVGKNSLYDFLRQARLGQNGASYYYNDFSWTNSGSQNYNESRYHFRVIMGDNDKIGLVRMTPDYETRHVWIQPNPAGTSLSVSPTLISSLGLTTSYGIDQGTKYGMRSMNTWDNRTIACYSPYYYYGSGINIHFVDTQDPSRGYYWQNGDTGWGWHPFPIGSGGIGIRYTGANVDGSNGVYVNVHQPSGAFKNGRQPNNTNNAVGNGGQLNGIVSYFPVDTGYTSTDYAWVLPMTTWTRTG